MATQQDAGYQLEHIVEVNLHLTSALIIQSFPQDAAMVHIKLYKPRCCATLSYTVLKLPSQTSNNYSRISSCSICGTFSHAGFSVSQPSWHTLRLSLCDVCVVSLEIYPSKSWCDWTVFSQWPHSLPLPWRRLHHLIRQVKVCSRTNWALLGIVQFWRRNPSRCVISTSFKKKVCKLA